MSHSRSERAIERRGQIVDAASLGLELRLDVQIPAGIARQSGSDFVANTKKQTGIDFKDLFGQVVMAGTGTLQTLTTSKPKVMVIKSKVAFTQRKIRNSAKNAAARKANGKTYYKVDDADFTYLNEALARRRFCVALPIVGNTVLSYP